MKDEIKEILDDLDYCIARKRGTITLNHKDCELLLDYITNLQKENEKLNGIIETLKETNHLLINQKYKLEYELDALDNRVEKAVEKSQELKDSIDKSNFDGMTKTILILGINQIQNILQNGSENDD